MKKEVPVMLNKKFKGILAVALLSTMALVSCTKDINAKPSNYKDAIVELSAEDDEIYHNINKTLADAYRDGTLASAVLDSILYQYSVSIFGRYNKVAEPKTLEGLTLKQAYVSAKGADKTNANTFIDAHKAYQEFEDDGTTHKRDVEYDRVIAKYEAIEERIAKSCHGDIAGGSYSERGGFYEKKYLASLRSNMHKVANPYLDATPLSEDVVITPNVKEKDVFNIANGGYLHRENYQAAASFDLSSGNEDANPTVSYVEDELIPSIYRSLLVEQYLREESYNTLGRSYARKVNILAISPNSNNDKAADYLMKYFVREKISKGEEITLEDFNEVSNAMKGLVDPTTKENAYLKAVNATASYEDAFPKETLTYKGDEYAYYIGTDYGDMMMKFAKIKDNINTTDSSAESEFTGGYTYTADVGLKIKEREIQGNDYTTDGWFIKDGGLSDLPDSIKTRLFNIGVATFLDQELSAEEKANLDRLDANKNYKNEKPAKESKLVCMINGKYYLKVAEKPSDAPLTDDILFNEGGKYYIVQIEEAISSSKIDKANDEYKKNATGQEGDPTKEQIITEVARVIGSNDKYQTLSTKHWLEQASIKYHDSKIYDYFKENYPDLF